MCGACGAAAPSHWSAPFLASLPARATAARAITAMIGSAPAVVAVPGGFLLRRPTGATALVAHLGAAWHELDRIGVPRPAAADPPLGMTGPLTLPPVRATILDVHLVLCDQPVSRPTGAGPDATCLPAVPGDPSAERHVDGRGADPRDLTARLHTLATNTPPVSAPRRVRLILGAADLPRTLPHLAAGPARPYQLRLGPSTAPAHLGQRRPSADREPLLANHIPALLAWAAARHGQGQPEYLAVQIPVGAQHSFQLDMLAGIVIRCTLAPITSATDSR